MWDRFSNLSGRGQAALAWRRVDAVRERSSATLDVHRPSRAPTLARDDGLALQVAIGGSCVRL